MTNEIKCLERLELKVDKSITAVRFINPDRVIDKTEPFCYQTIDISYNDEGIETIRENGECYFCVRYTPRVTGNLIVEYMENDNVIKTYAITVLSSDNRGYVTASKRDSRYFEYSDGTFFAQIGVNMAFPNTCGKSDGTEFGLTDTYMYMGLKQYERWIKKAAANGVNVVRLWLGHDYFSPDTENAYEFNMVQFSKIDEIVKIAKKYNVMLKITIKQFRAFDYENNHSGGSFLGKRRSDEACEQFLHEKIGASKAYSDWCPRPGSNRHGNLFPQDFKSVHTMINLDYIIPHKIIKNRIVMRFFEYNKRVRIILGIAPYSGIFSEFGVKLW